MQTPSHTFGATTTQPINFNFLNTLKEEEQVQEEVKGEDILDTSDQI